MANSMLTPSVIAKEALMQLENNLVMGNLVHRDYKKEFVKVGDTVSIRRPVKFAAQDGATLIKQDVIEGKTSITIDQRKHVGWQFSTQDLTLTIEEYSERYIKPATITLAQSVETALMGLYKNVWNIVGTPGTTPSTFAEVALAAQRLDEGAVPMADRNAVFNPAATYKIANDLKSLYVTDKARTAFENAKIGKYATFDTYSAQSIKLHTVGALGGTPLVNGASQTSTYSSVKDSYTQSLVTDGWTASAATRLKQGDVFTIAGVYSVNPITKESTGSLQDFVVVSDAASDGSGNMTITISPPIITSGAYQTVDAAPANDAALTIETGSASTAYAQNLCFVPNAFALVTCPLEMPDGVSFKARETNKGISMRVLKDYDIVNDQEIVRLDILFGVKAIYPELACRFTG